ncbi:hypothetical protein [Tomitella biformata]|uniref:hypothetical protein n=1 Tax=Tomitella biformata TaxID=630403 RepID=UPI0011DDFD09|nr:hypothetical protein [Tomitella biformata]
MRDPVPGETPTPPFAPELLADLHAGLLPDAEADALWPRAREDADAAAVLAALDTTAAELRTLGGPVEPMPEFVAARLQRTLLALPAAADDAASPPVAQRRGPWSRLTVVAAAAAAAIVVGAGWFVGLGQFGGTPPEPPVAAPPATIAGTLDLPDGTVPPSAALAVQGSTVMGRLSDARLRSDCLSANGYAADTTLLGAVQAKVGDRLGTLLLIPGDRPPIVIALVLGDRCSASNPDLLAVNTVSD